MRQDCKHYQSWTYASGETARKCNLDLAPEAPWRCPDDCPKYERRLADVDWRHGSLISPATPAEPPGFADDDVGALLDEAEDIVNAAAPEIVAELGPSEADRPSTARRLSGWWRARRRR
jgi:hypothetical protein